MVEPTLEGCARLFWAVRTILPLSIYPRDSDIGELIGLHNSETSNWKHGRKLITRFSQYLRLANACGLDVDMLYKVACGAEHDVWWGQPRTPMDLYVPEVTKIGSILLFFHVKSKMTESVQKRVFTGSMIGAILGFAPNEATRWKRGSRLITKVEHFYALAEATGDRAEYLYTIACSRSVPEHLEKYLPRAERYTKSKRKPKISLTT